MTREQRDRKNARARERYARKGRTYTVEQRIAKRAHARHVYHTDPVLRAAIKAQAAQWHADPANVEAVTYAMKANNANNAATLHGCEGKLVADDIRALILEPFVCYYCSAPLSHQKGDPGSSQIWQIDHVIPMTKQGPNTRENIVACCRSCNQAKGNKIVEKY